MRQTAYNAQGGYGMGQYGNNPFEANPIISSGVHDPFAMSNSIAPPTNVQMAAMAQQQHAMMLQQQPQHMMPVLPSANSIQPAANPFGDPFETGYPHHINPHENNPFGNPGLL